ncbi:sensor histidine kinase [Kribbella sp. WER1]
MNVPPASTKRSRIAVAVAGGVDVPKFIAPKHKSVTMRSTLPFRPCSRSRGAYSCGVLAERVEGYLRSHRVAVDGVAAGLLLVVVFVVGWAVRAPGVYFAFSGLLVAPLAVRRRWPAVCLAAVALVGLVQWLSVRDSVSAVPADVAVPIAVHAAAAYGPAWLGRVGLGGGLVGAVLGGLAWPRLLDTAAAHLVIGALLASTVVAAWAVGSLQRVRRVQGEREREYAVLAERTRIAREMHDVVAHSLAVVIAQADGGRYAAGHPPTDPAITALTTIGQHARQALAETRQTLGILRSANQPTAPAPGLDELDGLIEEVRAGGQSVEATIGAPSRAVDPALGLAVYRIVQEGLTNVMKHAGPQAHAEVTVRWTPDHVEITVADDGPGPAGPPGRGLIGAGGFGLVGIGERVAVYGGTVGLRARDGGGSLLTATIPA